MSKHLFKTMAAALGLLCTGLSLQAQQLALRLSADNGATWTTINDGSALDLNTNNGAITFDGAIGVWLINADTGDSLPVRGTATQPYISLNGVNLSSAPGTMIVQLSETGFISAAAARAFTNNVGGTTEGSTVFNAYVDSGNVLFGSSAVYTDVNSAGVSPSPTAVNIAAQGPFVDGVFANSDIWSSSENGGGPFSVTVEVIITHSSTDSAITSYQQLVSASPPPAIPAISVIKQIACLQPTNNCSDFGKVAEGFKGLTDPAFCYQITVTNNGTLTVTNITVMDSLLGNITTNFFGATNGTLAPGQIAFAQFKMSLDTTTTNTAIVAGVALNTDGSVNTNVTAVDNAVGIVDVAGVTATVTLLSSCDEDNNPTNNHVLLPGCGEVCNVMYVAQICNTGAADLTNVTLVRAGAGTVQLLAAGAVQFAQRVPARIIPAPSPWPAPIRRRLSPSWSPPRCSRTRTTARSTILRARTWSW